LIAIILTVKQAFSERFERKRY